LPRLLADSEQCSARNLRANSTKQILIERKKHCVSSVCRERERERHKRRNEKQEEKGGGKMPPTASIHCTMGVGNRFAARDPMDPRARQGAPTHEEKGRKKRQRERGAKDNNDFFVLVSR